MPKNNTSQFSFEISLSVLNHLGRNLYRSFSTVLGEAISNSWDADAENVWITLDKEKNRFFVKDDGVGMNYQDFQERFLRIGYAKRKQGNRSPEGRSYIGRKGIGKLALLSCADKVTVISKRDGDKMYVGGVIDNSGLDAAITDDLATSEYRLGEYNLEDFPGHIKNHDHGTIICFDEIKSNIRNTPDFFRKIVAMYFKFSLHDSIFKIHIDGRRVSYKDLRDLAESTQFLWRIDGFKDPYIDYMEREGFLDEEIVEMPQNNLDFKGFIASVQKPRDRTIQTMGEKIGVDLFVNGRVRAKDILRPVSASRITESYLYGQIHYDELDNNDQVDRFTSGREDIVANDEKYEEFLKKLKPLLKEILDGWDEMRRSHNQDGDDENTSVNKEQRKSEELYNAIVGKYDLPENSANKKLIKKLKASAKDNLGAYANCFVSENLVREYIRRNNMECESLTDARRWQEKERGDQKKWNVNIDIRERSNELLTYASMDELLRITRPTFPNDQKQHINMELAQYNIIRNALAHTAILTKEAKRKLVSVSDNIKAKISVLFSSTRGNS